MNESANGRKKREQFALLLKANYPLTLQKSLADSYILVHMTGTKMNRQEYFDAILDGTLNYYSARHEHMSVSVNGNTANMTGDTCVEAAVYGGSRRFWPLRLKCEFIKENDVWKMTRSVASQY